MKKSSLKPPRRSTPIPASARRRPGLDALLARNGYTAIVLVPNRAGHLVVRARINNVEGTFAIDTGAGATMIEHQRAARFALKADGRSTDTAAGAGGGGLRVVAARGNRIAFGSYHRSRVTLQLMSLKHVNAALRVMGVGEVDGVIGADLLAHAQAVIDYRQRRLYLRPRRASR